MTPALLFHLSWRGLLGSPGTFALLVAAVAIGAGFQIPNAANLEGLQASLVDDGVLHGGGDVRVVPRDGSRFADGAGEAARLAALVDARAALPVLAFAGAIGHGKVAANEANLPHSRVSHGAIDTVNDGQVAVSEANLPIDTVNWHGPFVGAPIYGIDAIEPRPYRLVSGTDLAAGDRGILIGATIAQRLGAGVGDVVDLRVIFGTADHQLDDSAGRFAVRVRGIVSGSAYRSAFVDRAFLADAAGVPRAASTIAIHLGDHEAARAEAAAIAAARPDVIAVAWRDDDSGFASFLDAKQVVGGVSYAMVIAAIAIPMWALLYIQVLRRRRELAILRALGFSRGAVFATCAAQALVIAAIGCAIGAGIGALAIRYFDANPLFEVENFAVRPVAGLGVFVVPIVVIVATAFVAVIHPVWRASRIEPAIALRSLE